MTSDPEIERLTAQLRQTYIDQGLAALPSVYPLAVNDFIFTRSVAGLVAIDFKTGKRVWNGPIDDATRALLDSASVEPASNAPRLAAWLDNRLWDDNIYGSLSSDGRSIFCVEDLASDLSGESMRTTVGPHGRILIEPANRPQNRLASYSIATEGKLEWDLAVAANDPRPELAGAFFLGPPLPLAGRLYVLAETKGEIRLIALRPKSDADTGATGVEVEWSQQLAMVERTISEDDVRRLAGATPSFADGVLVCPTSAGAVIAVDLATRSLLWGYRYQRGEEPQIRGRMAAMQMSSGNGTENEHWCDATVTIADDRVLVTPVESPAPTTNGVMPGPEIHCLNLLDGSRLWTQPREDGLYIGSIEHGKVTIVGSGHLRQHRLSDGKLEWTTVLPAGSMPSGRGFFTSDRYFLPLTSAEVAAIDLRDGHVSARAKSRSGQIPGNLICYHGSVVSQGADCLESFYQLDELRQYVEQTLATNAANPQAQALKAELALNEGRLDEALGLLRQSFQSSPDPRTRQLLIDALLQGLHDDFARYRSSVPELDRLIEHPAQRLPYLRELAIGLQATGETLAAFNAYLKLADLPTGSDELERIGPDATLLVRRDRWIQAHLRSLHASATSEVRRAIDAALQRRLDEATEADTAEALRRFLSFFEGQPIADEARMRLARRVAGIATPLESEQLLRQLAQSENAANQRSAVASLVRLLKEGNRIDDAAPYTAELARWSNDICLDQKTGAQLLAEWFPDDADPARSSTHAWPVGLVQKEVLKPQSASMTRVFPIDIRGPRGPYFDQMTVEFDQQAQVLLGRDGLGHERWRVSLSDNRNTYGFNHTLMHTRVDGHLVIASMGFQLIAIDTLGATGKWSPRILWRQDLTDVLPSRGLQPIQPRVVNMPWGMPRLMANDSFGRPVGTTGPVTSEMVCFQRQRQLVAIHPLTGKTLWVRSGIQPGSDIFGDDEMLFVTPPNSTTALVLRATDGHELGRRSVPAIEQRLATSGHKVLVWYTSAGRAHLKLTDVWAEQELWQQVFSSGAKPWPLEDQTVGVLQLDGRFALLNIADGHRIIDAKLPAESSLTEIFVFRTPDRYLLVTNRPWANRDGDNIQPIPSGGFGNPLIHGNVFGFDRTTGECVFTTPVEGRALSFHQPASLPFLMFAAQVYRQQRSMRESQPQVAILCIDKRTGRIIYDDRSAGPIPAIELVGDRDAHEALIRTPRLAVKLKFTEEAWPPESEKPPKPEDPLSTRAGRTISRSIEDWIDQQLVPLRFIFE
ncbi:MAG TPA: PQQ-binding-like beta-propeller repeat protein [Pirellulales bacterium]|nr:PQQ-binding-like beta-propeller repeat protein [Pirellulales bacterium]